MFIKTCNYNCEHNSPQNVSLKSLKTHRLEKKKKIVMLKNIKKKLEGFFKTSINKKHCIFLFFNYKKIISCISFNTRALLRRNSKIKTVTQCGICAFCMLSTKKNVG